MSVREFLQQKTQKDREEKRNKADAISEAQEQNASKIQAIAPAMKKMYSLFYDLSREIRKAGYCCTLRATQYTDFSSNNTYTGEIYLGGIWQKKPTHPCKELDIISLMKDKYISCRIDNSFESVTFSLINRPATPIHYTHKPSDNLEKMAEEYVEQFLKMVIGE